MDKVLIVDLYTDEPSGLGVSPYIDTYPRYLAGAIWHHNGANTAIHYVTADEFRNPNWLSRANNYDIVFLVGGITVPGRYLDGNPPSLREITRWVRLLKKPLKILGGPASKFGMGLKGGEVARLTRDLEKAGIDIFVTGDLDEYVRELIEHGVEKAAPWRTRKDYDYVDIYAVKGARIVRMHRRLGHGLIAEIESYRGCPRWIAGGCSFCIEPLYGKPLQRNTYSIVKEIEALYQYGVIDFRIGRQADFYVIGSRDLGNTEWPKPNPTAIHTLLRSIRINTPELRTLHIDNVNPGTIVRYPKESIEITKTIIRYHTSGDVAALGIETADPKVARINNLNITSEEAIRAIEILSKYGSTRDTNGVPHLLPGINFVLGLPGESRTTMRVNKEFLMRILEEGYLVRRINVRRLMVIPGTRVSKLKPRIQGKWSDRHSAFIRWIRGYFDREMLGRAFPPSVIIRNVYVEEHKSGYSLARPPGSYPPTVKIKGNLPFYSMVDVVITGVASSRSLKGESLGELF
ncbi:MAG: radical SAM protein [Desulfurococcales archaeon]|nr:radical SAM protein [Desulfurococcales archaeon]